jgi:hypothetical protein
MEDTSRILRLEIKDKESQELGEGNYFNLSVRTDYKVTGAFMYLFTGVQYGDKNDLLEGIRQLKEKYDLDLTSLNYDMTK